MNPRSILILTPAVLIGVSLSLLFLSDPVAHGQADVPGAQAVKATQSRQDFVKTVKVEYKRTEVIAAGSLTDPISSAKARTPLPAKETTLESVNVLVIDGKKYRCEENHPGILAPEGNILHRQLVWAYDGELGRLLAPTGLGGEGEPVGVIERGLFNPAIRGIHILPLTLTFRGLMPAISPYVVSDLKPSGVTLPLDGSKCDDYLFSTHPKISESFWLDPAKDYVVRRHQRKVSQRVVLQTDITYRRHESGQWVPASWKRTGYSLSNTVDVSENIEVLELRINESQPAAQFSLRFPPGCKVEDQRTMKEYVIQTDGSMREVTRGGSWLSGSIPQPGTSGFWSYKWLMISVGGLLAILLVGYCVRRYRKRAA